MATIRIGVSGWRYSPWRGVFYPPGLTQHRELAYAAQIFPSIEINGSFYSLQRPEYFAQWYDDTPSDFVFAVKGPRFITHMKKLLDCEDQLDQFIALARPLGDRLGPLLYQLPPSLHKDLPRLETFLTRLPPELEQVVEFRHKSWYDEDVLALLDRFGIEDSALRAVAEIMKMARRTKGVRIEHRRVIVLQSSRRRRFAADTLSVTSRTR